MKPFRSALPPAGLASLLAGLLWQQQVSLELAQLDREACAMCLHLMAQPPASVQHEIALAELEGLLSARTGLQADMLASGHLAQAALAVIGGQTTDLA